MAHTTDVWKTYEPLEHILLHLPIKDLPLAQRVCKVWQSVWKRSQNIQRALLMVPSSDTRLRCEKRDSGQGCDECEWESAAPKPILNPFLPLLIYNEGYCTVIKHYGLISPSHPSGKLMITDPCTRAIHRDEASWEPMLLLQPPTLNLAIFCSKSEVRQECPASFLLESNAGVSLRGVVDGVRRHWFGCPNCPFIYEDEEVETDSDDKIESRGHRLTFIVEIQWELDFNLSIPIQEVPVDISGWDMLRYLTDMERSPGAGSLDGCDDTLEDVIDG